MEKIQNYVNGELIDPVGGQWLDNDEPATGQVFAQVPQSDKRDLDLTVEAAEKAFPEWSSAPIAERVKTLNRLADLCDQHAEALVELESRDNGKPRWLARSVDIPRVGANLRFFASLAETWSSEAFAMHDGFNLTLRQPIGVVATISPWNLPLYLFSWKVAPALAVGNCVIGKPSEVTPMTAHYFSKLCIEAGMPPGVLNVLHGDGPSIGDAITEHPGIKVVSFTGGTATGRKIAAKVAPTFKKFSLELGGKNPNVILADCDYEKMMETTLRSSFANQGQICLCGSRIYVEESLYEKFRDDFVERAAKLKVGDPNEDDTKLGAVVSKPHFEKILSCLETAKSEGGKILCGGKAAEVNGRCENGYFIQPTVIEGLPVTCQTNQTEIFGPVVNHRQVQFSRRSCGPGEFNALRAVGFLFGPLILKRDTDWPPRSNRVLSGSTAGLYAISERHLVG